VNRGSFSPDGTRVLTAASDHTARIWDARSGEQLLSLAHPDAVMSATWSPDGRLVATACWDHYMRVWSSADGRLLQTFAEAPNQLLDVSFDHGGSRLASTGHDGQVLLWNRATATPYMSLDGHSGPATSVVWSPDDALIATSADDQTARIWDAATGKLLATRTHRSSVMQVTWSRSGDRILTAGVEQGMRVWDVRRDAQSLHALESFAARSSPWRLEEGRLELVRRGNRLQ
jgi:WD40 repeat protein